MAMPESHTAPALSRLCGIFHTIYASFKVFFGCFIQIHTSQNMIFIYELFPTFILCEDKD